MEIAKNKPCINNCIGMEISECDDTDYCINPGNSTECIPSENSNPKPCSNTQMNSNSNTTSAKVEAMDNNCKGQSSLDVPQPDSGHQQEEGEGQKGCGFQCLTVEAEIRNLNQPQNITSHIVLHNHSSIDTCKTV